MKSLLICVILLMRCLGNLCAQGENNIWCFGTQYGLNFNSPLPPSQTVSQINLFESGASVSDAAGNLLFYTNGVDVRDRNHNIMPNGTGLSFSVPIYTYGPLGIGARNSSLAIVKSTDNQKYYIITVDAINDGVNKAYFTEVNMALNNGLGGVVTGRKNIAFSTDVSEGVVVSKITGCLGYWIILHRKTGADYLAYKVDNNGIASSPVLSSGIVGNGHNYTNYGMMAMTTMGDKLVRSALSITMLQKTNQTIETAVFNQTTGQLSAFKVIDTSAGYLWFPEFSSDGSKLYCSVYGTGTGGLPGIQMTGIYQYNTSLLPNATAVQNSKVLISPDSVKDSRLAPDGKIYFLRYASNTLGVINSPNNIGVLCNYNANGFSIVPYNAILNNEMGSNVVVRSAQDTVIREALDTIVCFRNNMILSVDSSLRSIRWNNGETVAQRFIDQDGIYWLSGIKDCIVYIDTFHVKFIDFNINLGEDTVICEGDELLISPLTEPSAHFFWQDGSTASSYTVKRDGIYTVAVTQDGCTHSDSIKIEVIYPEVKISEPDTVICKGNSILLHAIGFEGNSYTWNNGSVSDTTRTGTSGMYVVSATNICGTFYDSISVQEINCPCRIFIPTAFSPNGDSRNDKFQLMLNCPQLLNYQLSIYNRFGQRLYLSVNSNESWDGTHNGIGVEVGTYYYALIYESEIEGKMIKRGDITLIR